MLRTVKDFETLWMSEAVATEKMLRALTDASLAQEVAPGHRSAGRIAWHIAATMKEMMERTGLHVSGPAEHAPVPASAAAIADAYAASSASLLNAVGSSWTDVSLDVEDEMYGEKWARGQSLTVLIVHQAHHRGQLSVLMRQAELKVPGPVGPAKEDWAQWQMAPPEV